jgi:hypothetical protein
MKSRQSERTLVTLANGSELVGHIVKGVVGNEIADSFDGSPLMRSTLFTLAQAKFQSALDRYLEK